MAGELQDVADDFVAAIDAMDVDRLMEMTAEDAQGVDEISRRWLRGKAELDGYLRPLMHAISDVRTEFREPDESVQGDTGVVTGWLEQDYLLEGTPQHVSAPTTMIFHREG